VSVSVARQNRASLTALSTYQSSGAPHPHVRLALPPTASPEHSALLAGRRLLLDLSEHTASASGSEAAAESGGGKKLTLNDGKPLDEAFLKRLLDSGDEKTLAVPHKHLALLCFETSCDLITCIVCV
jgi:hypothetical protein